jgi:uncharacterized LabA/DUF88 family protein
MNKPKLAILADIASLKITCEGFQKLMATIEKDFEVVYCKFYSYVDKRNRDFNEYIAAKGYDAVTPIASRRRNRLDTRQIIDATEIALSSTIDAIAFSLGEGDIIPITSYLKLKGKDVYLIDFEESKYQDSFTGFIQVPEAYRKEGYAAPTKKQPKAVKKAEAPKRQESIYVRDAKRILDGGDVLSKYRR